MSSLPVVAVVGRPNVGKSTLVNRIIGSRSAVVEEQPGVTRDRRQFEADWAGRDFILVDTGGWEARPGDPLDASIREQAEAALSGADVIVFVLDATTDLGEDDKGVASILKRGTAPVVVAANKVDNQGLEVDAARLWSLGLGEPSPVSAFHGRGVGDLLDRLVAEFPDSVEREEVEGPPRLAIIGRPNVGKSTLLNRLVGEERVIVSDRPGTTRDPIDVTAEIDGEPYVIVDTAGIRRKPQITEDADFYAILRARDALGSADVALLVLDATEGVTHQDQRIAREIAEAGAGLILLFNKWDALDPEQREITERSIPDRLDFVGWAPLIRMSAKTGSRVHRIGDALEVVLANRSKRIPTGELNRKVREWVARHPPPVRKGRRPKVLYAVQAGVAPPTIILFVSGGEIGDDYLRFLENRMRAEYDFVGTPIHVMTRAKERR